LELPGHLDVASAWREIRVRLRAVLGDSQYTVWVEPLELHSLQGDTLYVTGPEQTAGWLRKRYGPALKRCVREVLGPDAQIAFTGEQQTPEPSGGGAQVRSRESDSGALNPRYSFDQFIIGDSNRLAHGAALAVAELPGQAYNPLFLHAPPGLGKTHLLHAIGNYVQAFGGGARVRYTTVEAFTNHFIVSLGKRSLDSFKQAYRDADVLLIDDVQFLASKAKTEEEFFHTFNAIYESGRQLVLTCDRLPSQLDGIAERLRERFEAGLVADIQPPNFETRVAILRKRVVLDGIPLAQDGVLELIAERVLDNVRALEGALIRVVAFHSLTGKLIDRELAAHVLDGLHYTRAMSAGTSSGPLSLDTVKSAVAAHYGLSVGELISPSRAARVAWPRQLAIHLARELTGAPLTTIGSAFGGRNHATVLHACRRVAQRRQSDQQAAVDIDELTRSLRGDRGDRTC
jgi:chromosomal replication initiator protein